MNDAVRPTPTSVARIGHIALMTPNLARLVQFYVEIFGGTVTSSTGNPAWKCTIQLAPGTMLHLYEVPAETARKHDDLPYDTGSINHFALEVESPQAFLTIRDRLMAGGYTDAAVMAAPYGYSVNVIDPDGLYLEVTLARPDAWEPPFRATAFRPLPTQR
ncbi:MAG: VOC family protein [Thermomicrobiales bacterium]|nr:VOC family protein [Thermomicrobiales bacterium]